MENNYAIAMHFVLINAQENKEIKYVYLYNTYRHNNRLIFYIFSCKTKVCPF